MLSIMLEETSRTLRSTYNHHIAAAQIPQLSISSKMNSAVTANTVVSERLRKLGEIVQKKVQHCMMPAPRDDTLLVDNVLRDRRKRRNNVSPSVTRLEGLVIKEGILPELSESDITMLQIIGRGAYGDVYQASIKIGSEASKSVAVKTLKCCRIEKAAAFLRELHILRLCGKHPNIVQFHGALTNSPEPKVVLQLCSRGDLFTMISTCKPCHDEKSVYGIVHENITLTFPRVFRILRETATGLDYLHGMGVIHRDISARNILLDETFTPKISDFGLSTHHSCVSDTHSVSQGVVTPIRWSAPEIVIERTYSHRSDVWSLGMLMVEVVSYGGVPWAKHTEQDIRRLMEKQCAPEPPHNTYYTLQLLIRQCWNYNPVLRPKLSSLAESLGRINVMST